jgi:hypothetical protein
MVMNYLELVNDVLIRLRENEVSAITDTPYSKLIAKFVNDAKRQVEDAYAWNSLSETLTASTADNIFNYVLVGSGQRFRVIDVLNDTSNTIVQNATTRWMNDQFLLTSVQKGSPAYYNFNGTNSNGDTQVDLFPIPNGVYEVRFNVIKPQVALAADADVLLVPSEPVIFNATARAIAERGEDGGILAGEMAFIYNQSLADAIAIESGRYIEESAWMAY